MDGPSPIELDKFVKTTGVATPGAVVAQALRTMKERSGTDEDDRFQSRRMQLGKYKVGFSYSAPRNWVTVEVYSAGLPGWVYDQFWHEDQEQWNKNNTVHRNSLSAENPAKVMASVNSLSRKVDRDVEKYMILADIRKRIKKLPEETRKQWNTEAGTEGIVPPGGLHAMNLQQMKVLLAWFNRKMEIHHGGAVPTEADDVVESLLEDEEESEELAFSPEDLTKMATGIGFKDEDFIFDEHQSRFGGYGTGSWTTYVKWKKRLRKGQPIYLGTIRQVHRPYNNQWEAVPHEGEWYIDSVPTVSRERKPRGVRWKPLAPQKWATRGGYGIVRFRRIPETWPRRYFRTRAHAAGYLASMILPHRHLKVVESDVASFVDYLRNVGSMEPAPSDFVYKDRSNPKTRHLEDDGKAFDVYAKRAPVGKQIPYIGTIWVEHNEQGTPVWFITRTHEGHYPQAVTLDTEFASRHDAATLLWKWFVRSSGFRQVLPPPDPPF